MGNESIISYRNIWKISYPIILSLAAQNVINVIDTAFLGRVGEVELGASALGGVFYIAMFTLGFGFGIGSQILIGRRNGAKKYKDIGIYFDHGIYVMLLIGVLLIWANKMFTPALLETIIESDAVFQATDTYLSYRMWGVIFAFLNMVFRAFYVGITKTKVMTFSAIIMAIVNIILDYILIFGHFGFEPMGIKGAAIASVIAEGVAVMAFLIYTLVKIDLGKYGLFRFLQPNLIILRKTFEVSIFVMLQYFISMAGWFTFFLIVEKLGERALAISNITRSIYLILMIPYWAFGSATNTIVSNVIGAGMKELVLKGIYKIIHLSFASAIVAIAVTITIPRTMLRIYTNDPSLIEQTVPVLYVVTGALVLFSIAIILFNGVSGTANTNYALIIEMVTIAAYLCYTYVIVFVYDQPIEIAWTSEYVYFFFMGGLSYLYLKFGNWRKKEI